jgi:hypothetical protein
MHTVEMLERLLAASEELGYGVRHEWLGGSGGGACEFGGRKWLFVDLALNAVEQLEQVAEALQQDPAIRLLDLTPDVANVLNIRRAQNDAA